MVGEVARLAASPPLHLHRRGFPSSSPTLFSPPSTPPSSTSLLSPPPSPNSPTPKTSPPPSSTSSNPILPLNLKLLLTLSANSISTSSYSKTPTPSTAPTGPSFTCKTKETSEIAIKTKISSHQNEYLLHWNQV
ncbi:hypothetical protein LR48_Vigan01g315600 [Vigna angularis]|uniref:Uncharacterized protein n=1 Tax=Phaseolus angularis TaxID=3914 RepID=A0A0L9TST4_PHAAN|nr:hypothetical protein LR48_Vigan01g315600 [Vigna angularis]